MPCGCCRCPSFVQPPLQRCFCRKRIHHPSQQRQQILEKHLAPQLHRKQCGVRSAMKHQSNSINEDAREMFTAMCPDCETANKFSCSKDESSNMTRFGLTPSSDKQLITNVSYDTSVFMFDDSLTRLKIKQLHLHVHFQVINYIQLFNFWAKLSLNLNDW